MFCWPRVACLCRAARSHGARTRAYWHIKIFGWWWTTSRVGFWHSFFCVSVQAYLTIVILRLLFALASWCSCCCYDFIPTANSKEYQFIRRLSKRAAATRNALRFPRFFTHFFSCVSFDLQTMMHFIRTYFHFCNSSNACAFLLHKMCVFRHFPCDLDAAALRANWICC